jgi:hypothetical protein
MKINPPRECALRYTPVGKSEYTPLITVHTVNDNLLIGTLKYSSLTHEYEYFPTHNLFIQYTDEMLRSIANIILIANRNADDVCNA